jgi:hypothetical protein
MRIVDLEAIADALETAAGGTTSANPNAIGRWKRIAAAAETLAGASTTANPNLMGFMKRTAVALESIAGTSGAEENPNERGYMKRIVDALEVQSGSVETGSIDHRMVLGAQNASFIELAALTLDDDEVAEDAAIGVAVGAIVGRTVGSTLTLTDDAGGLFALDGLNIEVAGALDFETAASHNITIRETLANASNSPRDSVIAITVTDVAESPYGPNLVLNGTFDADNATGWTLNRCSIGSNALQMVNATGLSGFARYTFPSGNTEAADYLVEWDQTAVTNIAGVNHNITLGGSAAINASADMIAVGVGHFSKVVTSGGANAIFQIPSNNGDDFVLDNFSVRKVL